MSAISKTTKELKESAHVGSAGGERSEPGGRAQRPVGAAFPSGGAVLTGQLPAGVRELLSDELVDELLAGARTEEEIVGPSGLLSQLTKRLVERALEVELTDHLGFEHGQAPPGGVGNSRNGRDRRRRP
jgi:hypothetical protein